MKQTYSNLLLVLMCGLGLSVQAQYNEVLKATQYGGVSNVSYNPAIAGNHFKFDMNIASLGLTIDNNYVSINSKVLTNQGLFDSANFQSKSMKEQLNGDKKSVFLGVQVQGPLSFMFSWGKNRSNKNAIAVTWNVNHITNIDNVSEKLARMSYWGLGRKADSITPFVNQGGLNEKNLSVNSMTWMDYGISYSRVVYDKGPHSVKVGGTLKLIQGLMGAYVYTDNFDFSFPKLDSLNIVQSDLQFGHSKGILDLYSGSSKGSNFKPANLSSYFSSLSVAADVGVVYEYSPKKDKYKYEMDCKSYLKPATNRYMLSVGFSVIDIGKLSFEKSPNSQSYKADITNWAFRKEPYRDVAGFDSVLAAKGWVARENNVPLDIYLPTRFNIFVDYNIWKGFGVNLNSTISPVFAKSRDAVHYPSVIMLTPRFDHAWFGAYLPITYTSMGNLGVGAGLRMGPLFVTSSNIITSLTGGYTYGANIQAGLKITIPNMKPRDRDKDGVSNKKDKCKKLKGNCETGGCPDKDGDGITDDVDACPDVAGPKETNGCPDRDKDGIIDMNDSCPDVPGLKEYAGCPDTDGDSIIDKNDECPTEKGSRATNGCPDRDGDGIADKVDACPDLAGDKAHKGCPDTDKDGIYDNEDKCPQVAGTVENMGCPWPDTDGDGVLDKDDECPKVFGAKDNKGCPKLEKKELETVKYAFQNLEFETGRDVIRTKSYPSLNSLSKLLADKPNYGLKIEGHTDNVGKPEMNMELSRKRAEAVKAYFVKKGLDGSRFATEGFGMTKPITDNKTPQARERNRRVEMTIVFK
jgi:outer membrane protein OmpA-like peptidoglycan-associated protein